MHLHGAVTPRPARPSAHAPPMQTLAQDTVKAHDTLYAYHQCTYNSAAEV